MNTVITALVEEDFSINVDMHKDSERMWLRDTLPEDLPNTRILIYGYAITSTDGNSF